MDVIRQFTIVNGFLKAKRFSTREYVLSDDYGYASHSIWMTYAVKEMSHFYIVLVFATSVLSNAGTASVQFYLYWFCDLAGPKS